MKKSLTFLQKQKKVILCSCVLLLIFLFFAVTFDKIISCMKTAQSKQTAEEIEEKNLFTFCKEPCSCEEISILDAILICSFIKRNSTAKKILMH